MPIINLKHQCDVEAKNHLIFSKISIFQQKFENFCKIWVVDAGYLRFNCFYFVTVISLFDTVSLCFFMIKWHFLCLMKVLIVLIPWVQAWYIHFACITFLNKLRVNKELQIDIITNKLDNSNNTTILWFFLLILILNQSYHQTPIADELP